MTDHPILFSAPMIRALLDGRKTQTRRVLKPQPPAHDALYSVPGRWWTGDADTGEVHAKGPIPYAPGDRLWVKEDLICATEQMGGFATFADVVCYAEDGTTALRDYQMVDWPWKRDTLNSRFCPRWASRLTLTVTDVRVQRLQDISDQDGFAEGIDGGCLESIHGPGGYRDLWNSLHGPDAWDANPWVAAYSFTVQRANIDQIGGQP